MSNLNIDRFSSILSFDGKIRSDALPDLSGNTFLTSDSYLTVKTTGTQIGNGDALKAAYILASTSTPGGSVRSDPQNRFTILLPPGTYDFGETGLVMDSDYIDIAAIFTGTVVFISTGLTGQGVVTINNSSDWYYNTHLSGISFVPGLDFTTSTEGQDNKAHIYLVNEQGIELRDCGRPDGIVVISSPIGKRIFAQILGSLWTAYAFSKRQIFLYGRASHGIEIDLRPGFLIDSFIDIYGFSVQLNNNTAYSEGYIGMHACYYTGNLPAGSDAIGCTH